MSTHKLWRRPQKEAMLENCRNHRTLPARALVYRLRAERLPERYSSASADEPVGFAVLRCDLRNTLLSFFLRRPTRSWIASALWIFRTSGARPPGCRDHQHPCFPSHDGASNDWSGPLGRAPVDTRLSAIPT